MRKLLLLFTAFFIQQSLFAQGVGINTTTPDPGAALDIKSDNKGLLIPRVNLQSKNDNSTMQSPPRGLLVFNTNLNMYAGIGFYYNDNNVNNPDWINLSKQFELPFAKTVTTNTIGFEIANFGAFNSSTAIRGHHGGSGIGVRASSISGLGLDVSGGVRIAGNGQSPGVGKVLTSDANGNATWEGAVAFRASGVVGGGSENIAKNILSKVPFALEEFDLGGSYNNSNQSPHSTFTAPISGVYHFDASVTWSLGGNLEVNSTELSIRKTKSGSTEILSSTHANRRAGDQTLTLSTNCLLQAGDQINISVIQYSFDYITLHTDSAKSHFSGQLISKQ